MNGLPQKVILSAPIGRPQILATFQKYGYPHHSMISRDKMYSILETEFSQKKHAPISRDLLEEIWNESEATSKGEISVETIADIILEAQTIVGNRVQQLSGADGMIETLDKKIQEKDMEVKQFAKHHGEDRNELNEVTKELINMQIQQKQNHNDLKAFVSDYETINGIFQRNAPKQYTQYLIPAKKVTTKLQKSNRLLTLFHITNALFIAELLILGSLRPSFVHLTALLHSYYILLFGFDKPSSLIYLISHFVLSIAGDLTFVVLFIINKYDLMPIRHTANSVYTIILLFVLLITVGVRVLLAFLYFTLRASYSPETVRYFSLMGYTFPPKQIPQEQPQYGYYSQYYREPESNPANIRGDHVDDDKRAIKEISQVQNYNINRSPSNDSPYIRNNSTQLQNINSQLK